MRKDVALSFGGIVSHGGRLKYSWLSGWAVDVMDVCKVMQGDRRGL